MKTFRLRVYLFFFLGSCSVCSIGFCQQKLPKISVEGNHFVKEGNQTIKFKGFSIADPDNLQQKGHWDKSLFQEAKIWGANLIRLPVHPATWRKQGKENYLKLLDEGIAWATELGLYVIIDWHSIGNLRTEMYQAAMYETSQRETFEFWRVMAGHFKGNTTVAFFELFNEPTTMSGQLGSCSWEQWKELNEEMIGIIRAHGCEAIPLVAGFNWAYDLTPIKENPLEATGIAYVSHPYPMKRKKPWESQWTTDWGFVAEKYPLILTEIGFCGPEEAGAHVPVISDESYGDAISAYTASKGISWVAWVFDDRWAPRMFTDWNYTPTRQGKYFKTLLQSKQNN
ncbi:MAG: glycoside hydrolase family 5 protein [Spirosomataceae bacterium]